MGFLPGIINIYVVCGGFKRYFNDLLKGENN